MTITPITGSSQISGVAYDADENILTVKFKRGGAVYQYLNVPPVTYEELLESESKGKYLHRSIKPFHVFRRIEILENE